MGDAAQRLLGPVRAAVQKYDMIRPGDHIAVGVSGGKDSLALLVLLARLRDFYPHPFSLCAITLDPCFGGMPGDFTPIADLCARLEIPYVLRRTRLWEVVFEERKEANPCSLCARMRRGALHRAAVEEGCRTVALGHHQDDAAETFLMNLLDGGTLACFAPRTELDRRGLTLIRPLIFLPEREVASFARRAGLPVLPSRCPADGNTRRQQMKGLIASLSTSYGPLTGKITGAMQKNGLSGW